MDAVPFTLDSDPPVRGFVHRPEAANAARTDAIVLTHGAGSNCQAPLLRMLAEALAAAGITVLRCDLPYRQKRPHGPPFPGEAARDRQGLRNAVASMVGAHRDAPHKSGDADPDGGAHRDAPLRIFLGGHSYGGRQATMLAAETPGLVNGLLLTSYPLHPPGQPSRLRTDHFPSLRTDALFVQGTRDPFGSIEEIEQALKLIPARTSLIPVEGAGHDLGVGRGARKSAGAGEAAALPHRILQAFLEFFA